MIHFFKEYFEYNYFFNQKILQFLQENQNNFSDRSLSLISHIVNVHAIWNNKLKPSGNTVGSWEVLSLEQCRQLDKDNYDRSLWLLEEIELNQVIEYTSGKGNVFHHKAADLMFQIVNHSTYHRGQLATEFRQSGFEPFLTDFIYYKMIQS